MATNNHDERAHAASGELLRAIGAALYGAPAAALAEELGVARRTVLRWLNGQNAVPDPVWDSIDLLLGQRVAELQRLGRAVAQLRRVAAAEWSAGERGGKDQRA